MPHTLFLLFFLPSIQPFFSTTNLFYLLTFVLLAHPTGDAFCFRWPQYNNQTDSHSCLHLVFGTLTYFIILHNDQAPLAVNLVWLYISSADQTNYFETTSQLHHHHQPIHPTKTTILPPLCTQRIIRSMLSICTLTKPQPVLNNIIYSYDTIGQALHSTTHYLLEQVPSRSHGVRTKHLKFSPTSNSRGSKRFTAAAAAVAADQKRPFPPRPAHAATSTS